MNRNGLECNLLFSFSIKNNCFYSFLDDIVCVTEQPLRFDFLQSFMVCVQTSVF